MNPPWRDFPDDAPKDGTPILVAGKWKPYETLEGGQWAITIARWSTLMSDGTGHDWIADLSYLKNWNVEWTNWRHLGPLPDGKSKVGYVEV